MQEKDAKEELEENFYQKIANPYEIKSYHKPQPLTAEMPAPVREAREPEKQQRDQRPSKLSREISSANKASRVFQTAPAMDYYAEQEEKVRQHRDMLKQSLADQIAQDLGRKRQQREQKEMEDKYWEERAIKQLAEMNTEYEREKQNEAKISAKAGLGSQIGNTGAQVSKGDALDKLKHEIFDKPPGGKAADEKSVSKKPTMSYEQLQKIFKQQHQKRDRSQEKSSERAELYRERLEKRMGNSSLSPNKSGAEDDLNQDPDLDNSRQRDFSSELTKFRQMRKEKLNKEGPIQKPYDYYLNLHKKRYELGQPENTKVYNSKAIFLTDLEAPQNSSKLQSQKSLSIKQSQKKLTPQPATQSAVNTKVLPPTATTEDHRIHYLQKHAFAQIDDFKDLKQAKLKTELRQDILKKTKMPEPVRLTATGTRVMTYGIKGSFVPTVNWLADHDSQQEAREKYAGILAVANKGEHRAQELRNEIEKYKTAMSFRLGEGLEDSRVQILKEEEQDKHLKQVVKDIEELLASR